MFNRKYPKPTSPVFELVDRGDVKDSQPKNGFSVCQNCNQRVRKVDGIFQYHTRRVFRSMISSSVPYVSGQPDYVSEVCPNRESE